MLNRPTPCSDCGAHESIIRNIFTFNYHLPRNPSRKICRRGVVERQGNLSHLAGHRSNSNSNFQTSQTKNQMIGSNNNGTIFTTHSIIGMMMLMMIGIIVLTMRPRHVTRVKMTGVMTWTINNILQIFNLKSRNCLRCTVAVTRSRPGPRHHHLPKINPHHPRLVNPLVPV